MIIYTQTPDYYQEYLEHGWLKDQAAKVHKYLERWRGKNGKWYYRYTNAAKNAGYKLKSKMTDAYVRFNRKRLKQNPEDITRDMGLFVGFGADNGRATSRSGKVGYTKNGISAGRKRAEEQKKEREWQNYDSVLADRRRGEDRTSQLKSKGYKQGNLSKKGYSNSTSGDNSSAIKKSKIVANQKQKALDKRGYYNSKVDTPYKKKPSLGTRGYISSRPLESYAYDGNETKHLSRLNILDKGGFAIGSGKPEKVKESYRSPVNQDIHNRGLSNLSTRSAVTNLRTPEKTRRRTKTRSRKRNL